MARKHRPARPLPTQTVRPAPPRRTGLIIGLAVVALAIAAAAGWLATRRSQTGPFILISIDTLRADRLPSYGYQKGSTPTLSGMAAEGIVFERAYAHAPQTLPSHASMFTGLLPFEHKVRDNLGFTLSKEPRTLAELFAARGYATAGFASAFVLRGETGVGRGFATYDTNLPAAADDRSPAEIVRSGVDTIGAATSWLGAQTSDRFFLFLHIYEPHAPYTPPAKFTQPDKYDGEVAWSDEIIGTLFAALRQRGWYDNATIVVTSDHGEGLGDHGEQEHGLFIYNSTVHVPLIVKLPRGERAGARVTAPVQHIDLLPTLVSRAGLERPPGVRGRDLSAALTGGATPAPQGIYAEAMYPRYHFGWSELTSLTDERYKLIRAPRAELYDLERDPGERTNVIGERAQAAAALSGGLDTLIAGRPIDAPGAVSAEDRQRLAALGYVGSQAVTPVAAGSSLPDPKDKVDVLRRYRESIDLISGRQFDAGLAGLRSVLDENPDMVDGWLQYAATHMRIGKLEEAYAAYREAVRRKPDESSALLGAASVLLLLNRFDEARKYAELATNIVPATGHHTLANIAMRQGNKEDALRHADLAAKADPSLPIPQLIRGLIAHGEGRHADAVPLLMQAREAYAKRTLQTNDVNFYIGDSLAQLERYPEAEKFFLEEIRLYPQNTRARSALAMLYQAMGRGGDAERTIDEMLRVSPSAVTFDRAESLWRMFGRDDKAAEVRALRQRVARR
jgi:arylsulfatase A-like enzyme/tetratricopeptide (TPR) repeat protein